MTLSQHPRFRRKELGLSMAQLAKEVRLAPSYFSLLERGLGRLDGEVAVQAELLATIARRV